MFLIETGWVWGLQELQGVKRVIQHLGPKVLVAASQFQKCPRGGADGTDRDRSSEAPLLCFALLCFFQLSE